MTISIILTSGEHVYLLIVLDDSTHRSLSEHKSIVVIALRFVPDYAIVNLLSRTRVEPKRKELIKPCEGILNHAGHLSVNDVVEVAELIDHVKARIHLQTWYDACSGERNELEMQDL